MPYRWEPNVGASGRYRDISTGRYVPGKVVRSELDAYLSASDNVTTALAQQLRGRGVSLADWELAMRREVKRSHLNAITLERGGWANMRAADFGRAGQIIREQYGYLKGFAADIASGKQRLDGTLDRRAKLYTQAGRESFYKSKAANMTEGVTHVRSVRHAEDSCDECIELDGKVFEIDDSSFKLPGDRQCSKNCKCSLEYLNQGGEVVEAA